MSNIAKAFQNGKAFIPFITCGDPDLTDNRRGGERGGKKRRGFD